MKELKNLTKKFIILGLSLVLILFISNVSFAANDSLDQFFETSSGNNSAAGSTAEEDPLGEDDDDDFTNIAPSTNTALPENNTASLLPTNTVNNTNTMVSNSSVNRSVSNTNSLASTGIADNNGIFVLIVLVSAISAIYSFKKINDYKKI